jgi:hypothetical protein
VHVVPLEDLIEHEVPGGLPETSNVADQWMAIEAVGPDRACPCSPRLEHCPNPNGSDGWIVVHHSLDGREAMEIA